MAKCASCDNISDFMIDSIMCNGNCRRCFHVNCIDAPFSTIKLFGKNKSFYFFCDDCDPFAFMNIARDLIQNTRQLENLNCQLTQLSEKVNCLSSKPQTRSMTKNKNLTTHSSNESTNKRTCEELDSSSETQLSKKQATSIFESYIPPRSISKFNFNNGVPAPASLLPPSAESPIIQEMLILQPPPASSSSSSTPPYSSSQSVTSLSSSSSSSTSPLPSSIPPTNSLPAVLKNTDGIEFISPISAGLRAVEGQKILFVSKLHPSTNALDIKNHIASKMGSQFKPQVEKMIHRNHSKYSSFKIRVPDSFFHLLNSSSFWPNGIIFHEFDNKLIKKQYNHLPFQQNTTMQNLQQSSYKRF